MTSQARFTIGQVVHHQKFDYRGVIVDVDPVFAGNDEWYEQVARSRPPKDQPWYHVLVDNADQMTYVAERHLEADDSGDPIRHPALESYFTDFNGSSYRPRQSLN
ncbi:MAG: heat shock protein HspQ [Thiohalophilus sp.]